MNARILKIGAAIIAFLLTSTAVLYMTSQFASRDQSRQLQRQFDQLVRLQTVLNDYRSKAHFDVATFVGQFVLGSSDVTAEEFEQFISFHFETASVSRTIAWITPTADGGLRISHAFPEGTGLVRGAELAPGSYLDTMVRGAISSGDKQFEIANLSEMDFDLPEASEAELGGLVLNYVAPTFTADGAFKGAGLNVIDFARTVQDAQESVTGNLREYMEIGSATEPPPPPIRHSGGWWEPHGSVVHREAGFDPAIVGVELPHRFRFTPTLEFIENNESSMTGLFVIVTLVGFGLFIYVVQMRRAFRQQVEARQASDAANRMKSDFLATMSHEIRTPMNGVLGMAELIKGASPPPKIEKYAQTILSSGYALQRIIDDILDFSKIEAGRMDLDPVSCDLQELMDQTGQLFAMRAQDKGVELALSYDAAAARHVVADPVRFRQILDNLVSNAIKFTEEGYVAVHVSEVERAPRPEDGDRQIRRIRCEIKDTGIGLSEEARSTVFEKFQQADASTTRKFGGCGLGLSICRSLVALQNGDIGVDSKLGEGSTFWFEIEVEGDVVPVIKSPTVAERGLRRALVVDDHAIVRKLLRALMESEGVQCEVANNGRQALEMVRNAAANNTPYDVALVDYVMPAMNGEAFAVAVANDGLDAIPCMILVTAAGDPLAQENFGQGAFQGGIQKPVCTRTLAEQVFRIWRSSRGDGAVAPIEIDGSEKIVDKPTTDIAGMKVLVAEDNFVNQVFIREILSEFGCSTTVVPNGQEAVNAALVDSYDVVLMDCQMPVMDGFEAARQICLQKEVGGIPSGLPVIALTANALKGDRERCLDAGMDEYMTKPVRKDGLREMLTKFWERKHTSPEPVAAKKQAEIEAARDMPTAEDAASATPEALAAGSESTALGSAPKQAAEPAADEDFPTLIDEEAVHAAIDILKAQYVGMIPVFEQNTREQFTIIRKALAGNAISAVIRPAHTLKSSAKQMGAIALSEIAKSVEAVSRQLAEQESVTAADKAALVGKLEECEKILPATCAQLSSLGADASQLAEAV